MFTQYELNWGCLDGYDCTIKPVTSVNLKTVVYEKKYFDKD